ncbi:MAG TPA: hypothetical protein VGC30_10620 [Dokdonella sp.]
MSSWIATATALPKEGDAVQFVIEERDILLAGIYESCTFRSRWSLHSPGEVSAWRKLDADADFDLDGFASATPLPAAPGARRTGADGPPTQHG